MPLVFSTSRRSLMAATTSTTYRLRSTCPPGTRISSIRNQPRRDFRTSPLYYATKDSQDKDSLNPTSTEYSKSGGDNAAAHTKEAFDPSNTSPESETSEADSKSGDASSLNVSPGNPEVNKPKKAEQKAAGKSSEEAGEASDRSRVSSRGSPNKAGGGKSG